MRSIAALVLTVGFTGCATQGSNSPELPPADTIRHSQSFWGTWRVDQPFHALYEAEYLVVDGKNLAWRDGESCSSSPGGLCDVLQVAKSSVSCRLARPRGEAFSIDDARIGEWFDTTNADLFIKGVCSDEQSRFIHLRLTPYPMSKGIPDVFDAEVIDVEGESGWTRTSSFQWLWTKCSDPQSTDCRR
jgi:hypothetical protein